MAVTGPTPYAPPAAPQTAIATKVARLWPGLVLVAIFWGFVVAIRVFDLTIAGVFLSGMAASLLLALSFSIWWLTNRTVSLGERVFDFLALVIGGIVAGILSDPSNGPIGVIFMGVPMAFTAWMAWLLVSRRLSAGVRKWGLLIVLAVVWGAFIVTRVDGVDGQNQVAIAWRWSPSAEDRYLAERSRAGDKAAKPENTQDDVAPTALVLGEGDWPEFRGPNRQGEVHGVQIATDWNEAPPKQLWRQKIGPAWSSVLIIGERLFTQEQRGENEMVVCLDAATGKEIWGHADAARFSDGQAGAGPRATPTFSDGSIYSLGATGILNCLDAATGKAKWSRNIANDSGAPLPMWGFSSSPLVTSGVVVVYAGGPNEKGLLGYHSSSGEPAWNAATGPMSYSSPQLASIGGNEQVLFLSDTSLIAVDPGAGTLRWKYEAPGGAWRTVQPRQIEVNGFLIGSEDLGLTRVDVKYDEQSWTPEKGYGSKAMRPAYNDFVVSDGFVYGFDESIFCCADVLTGKRRWKAGRYGHGQVLLLADQPLLLVISETGEAVLVATNSEKHEELGRFQAVVGKTWNHPVIAHGRFFARNDEEIVCYELKPLATP